MGCGTTAQAGHLVEVGEFTAYKELKDESEFIRYGVDGTVFWANGADIAPEYLFENGVPC